MDAASIIARLVAAEQAVVQLYLAQVGVKNATAVEQRRVAAQEAVIDAQKAPVGDGTTPSVGSIERAAPEVPVELAAVDGHAPAAGNLQAAAGRIRRVAVDLAGADDNHAAHVLGYGGH